MYEEETRSENWIFDETKKTVQQGLTELELIKKLTIEKIEYGRICLAQFQSKSAYQHNFQNGIRYFKNANSELEQQIIKLGATPKVLNI